MNHTNNGQQYWLQETNYKAEVKKVYPDAAVAPMMAFGVTFAYFIEDLATGERLGKACDYEQAWQYVYETLKQQNKL